QFVHDWKECPYRHDGETAGRRHPRVHAPQPCPDFKNTKTCPRGDRCHLAHGPWEAGLHPAAFRTNLCAYGRACGRRMCFFAHHAAELRHPEYAPPGAQAKSGGALVYSPRGGASAAAAHHGGAPAHQPHQSPPHHNATAAGCASLHCPRVPPDFAPAVPAISRVLVVALLVAVEPPGFIDFQHN
ncbi:hypothetical protein T484DRAFT_1632873, partial [Baffinella frigidus]